MLGKVTTVFGEWKKGVNAGGQIANRSFPTNPQYRLDVKGGLCVCACVRVCVRACVHVYVFLLFRSIDLSMSEWL